MQSKREIGYFTSGDDVCLSIIIPEKENDCIITQNKSGKICFWKEENNNKWTMTCEISTDFFGFCKCFLHDHVLYTSLKDCSCQEICIKTKETIKKYKLKSDDGKNLGEIMALKVFSNNDNKLFMLVAYEGNQLSLWSLDDLNEMSNLYLSACPMAIDFDVKTNKGICGNPTNEFIIFSIDNYNDLKLKIVRSVKLVNEGVASVRIRPDSKLVAVGCWDGKLKLYSWKSLVLLAVLDPHVLTLQDICYIRTKTDNEKIKYLMAAASKDSTVSLWDIYN